MINKTFVYENISFDYSLLEENRKTITATVFPNCNIIVKVPSTDNEQKIYDFLKRKSIWILKQRRYFLQFSSQLEKEYVSGESFLYLGRQYKLNVGQADYKEYVSLSMGRINVHSKYSKDSIRTKNLLTKWFRKKTEQKFQERLEICFKLFEYDHLPLLKIRKLNKRWGSYLRSNTIILNPNLIKATRQQIDYVMIHELCHVSHSKHDRKFYDLLSKKLPDWKKIKQDLEFRVLSN